MATGVIDLEHWAQFEERTKQAWQHVVRLHGFDPNDVGFPLVIDGDTMVVREYLRNEQGMPYLTPDRQDVATRRIEVQLQTEIGLPRICRRDT
jgi:hypothetical protein